MIPIATKFKQFQENLSRVIERKYLSMVRTKLSSNSSVITKVRVIGMGFN